LNTEYRISKFTNQPARRSTAKEGNPKPETRNPKPETRNPQPATRNPKTPTMNHYKTHLSIFLIFLSISLSFGQNEDPKHEVDQLLTNWHRAAAEADFESYFSKMTYNAIYIGTDPEENWTKQEFASFAKPYFDKKQTWDFKAVERNIYISETEKTAWFDELLDTWMGVARGSGVLVKKNAQWKIKHYVLSFTIPNSKSKDVVQLKQKSDRLFLKKFKEK
jgi:hypothetical protein